MQFERQQTPREFRVKHPGFKRETSPRTLQVAGLDLKTGSACSICFSASRQVKTQCNDRREWWCWHDTIHGAGIFNLITHNYWHTVHWWFVVGGTVDVGKCAVLAYSWGFLEGAKWLLNVGKYYEYTIYIYTVTTFLHRNIVLKVRTTTGSPRLFPSQGIPIDPTTSPCPEDDGFLIGCGQGHLLCKGLGAQGRQIHLGSESTSPRETPQLHYSAPSTPKMPTVVVLCPQQYSHEMVGYDVSPYFDFWNPQTQKWWLNHSRRSFVMYPIKLIGKSASHLSGAKHQAFHSHH